ncbi:nuclear transport factor 2 family protein [Phyllobacterium sp. 0TCS1.6C]|uniref:limonene-1,2-epoxide hydrolase family protein n=1 Tax=unclassified Phyllobacterium TaxID=2638441 RepID=UPI0022651ECC|nr:MULTISPECIES: nuclear transport factor 2 family protein [unclassified Phyllobacterium]MCX8279200.1 nuclear transport factor 2 family protein [Phyllobacterium sp. 0TCS1.6C]MCX8293984.1 nuclear transport factor 2 family protein [Phyllobacterium sp. 0TCS1.6A]
MTSADHLGAFLEAMKSGDVDGAVAHVADDISLRSPILPAPFHGKKNVAAVLTQLVGTLDAFEPKLLLRDGADVVAVLTIRFEDHVIDAFDHIRLNNEGLIEGMTVAWRPLPAVVAVQQRLVPKLGGQAMQLVPLDQAKQR